MQFVSFMTHISRHNLTSVPFEFYSTRFRKLHFSHIYHTLFYTQARHRQKACWILTVQWSISIGKKTWLDAFRYGLSSRHRDVEKRKTEQDISPPGPHLVRHFRPRCSILGRRSSFAYVGDHFAFRLRAHDFSWPCFAHLLRVFDQW